MPAEMAATFGALPIAAYFGKKFRFVVTVLDADGVPEKFTDVFCQFRFTNKTQSAFATDSLRNTQGTLPFYFAQQICTLVDEDFLQYLDQSDLEIELFGHYEVPAAVPRGADATVSSRPAGLSLMRTLSGSLRSLAGVGKELPPAAGPPIVLSPPRPSQLEWIRHDILATIQIRELGLNGEYLAVRADSVGGHSVFYLTQGVQRRVDVCLSHECGEELRWDRVVDLQIGQICRDGDQAHTVPLPPVSLEMLPWFVSQGSGDERSSLHMAGRWDSSRHDTVELNRITPPRDRIALTLSITIEVARCKRTIVLKKQLLVRICAPGSAKKGFFERLVGPSNDVYEETAMFELIFKPLAGVSAEDSAAVEKAQQAYVRGEENLGEWRPRSLSLLGDHQQHLAAQERLYMMERLKQRLLLSEALERRRVLADPFGASPQPPKKRSTAELMAEVVDAFRTMGQQHAARRRFGTQARSTHAAIATAPAPALTPASTPAASLAPASALAASAKDQLQYLQDIKEVRPEDYEVVHRGFLRLMESREKGFQQYFVVFRRPFLLLYRRETDHVIRMAVRSNEFSIQYAEEQGSMMNLQHVFSLFTRHRAFLMQAERARDLTGWIEAFDPLLAGSILSRHGLAKKA